MQALRWLERNLGAWGDEAAARKLDHVQALARSRFRSARSLYRFHEVLCFLRAYPDSPELLREVVGVLAGFAERTDLKRFRDGLADSGIAGTETYYRYYWPTAEWLVQRCPEALTVDWEEWEESHQDRLGTFLSFLMPFTETLSVDELGYGARDLIEVLRSENETDAAFLVRRFASVPMGPVAREKVYEDLDPPLRLAPSPGTPSRSLGVFPRKRTLYRGGPLRAERPTLPDAVLESPRAVHPVSVREGRKLVDLARGAMVNRQRDLDIFVHADPRDVRMVDCGGGLEFACLGAVPERRLMVDCIYGFLTLMNGVPMGYVLSSALFGSVGVAYNVFETFRGGESGYIYGRVLAMLHHLFQADAFYVDPYQLGHENEEGQKSGAWWFYYKLGFRPEDPQVKRLLAAELARMRRRPKHRSSLATLNRLAASNMYYYLGQPRDDMLGKIELGEMGYRVSLDLAARFGADRERGLKECAVDLAELTGLAASTRLTPAEREAWVRWSPLVLSIPGIRDWPAEDLAGLIPVIRAKGGRRESDFVYAFDAHGRLRRALATMGCPG